MFSFRCFPLRLHEQKTNLSGHFNEVKSLRYPLFGILKYGRSPCKQVTVLATVFKNKFSGYIAAPIKGGLYQRGDCATEMAVRRGSSLLSPVIHMISDLIEFPVGPLFLCRFQCLIFSPADTQSIGRKVLGDKPCGP